MKQSEFHKAREGLTDLSVNDRLETYGTNFIKISVPPILYLLVHEVSFYRMFLHECKDHTTFQFA